MKDFKKTAGASLVFALIYTFCMYRNDASITFPILMAAGVWFLYAMQEKRKICDNFMSKVYTVGIALISVSVLLTGDWKLIFMSKMAVFVLYLCLAIEVYFDSSVWDDIQYVKNGIKMAFGSIGRGFEIFTDYLEYKECQKEEEPQVNEKKKQALKVFKGVLIALPLLFIIVPLMMSADVVFSEMIEAMFDIEEIIDFFFNEISIIGIGFTFAVAFFLYYGFIKVIKKGNVDEEVRIKNYGDKVTGITVTGIIGFIYGLFSLVQLRGIFFSNVKLPDGYTYAEYAREGFFQLFILAVINMIIVLVCASKYEYSKIMNIILYILCACTYIMIFSSAYKMILYIKEYNLTFLRLMVLWALLVVTFIMAAVIKYVGENDFSLFKYMAVVVTFFYIIAAFARPDYVIAKYNLEYGNQKEVDEWYLAQLSSDAILIISKHTEDIDDYYEERYFDNVKRSYEDMGLRTFNLSRYIGKVTIEEGNY